jgi:hypothetical protein
VNSERYLSVPANRELVRSIVSRVLLELEPSGAELELGYLEPLIDLAAKDEVIVADLWNEAGRFGNADLLGPIVVPLVLQALAHDKPGLRREEVKRAIRNARSSQGVRRLDEIEEAINKLLKELGSTKDQER